MIAARLSWLFKDAPDAQEVVKHNFSLPENPCGSVLVKVGLGVIEYQ